MKPNTRSEYAVKNIFTHLLAVMERHEVGIRKDIDPEALHQFRVALRRIRTLLSQTKKIIPHRASAKFRREFAWLGKVTSSTRDMDVYLLFLDTYKQDLLSKDRDALIPLCDHIRQRRGKEHRLMVKMLDGDRYSTLKKDWKHFLTARSPSYSTQARRNEAIVHAASEFIWRAYKRTVKRGRKIDPGSPPGALHELRKIAKRLRYLLDFFQPLYPLLKTKKMVGSLKRLQDILGKFQDLQVQQSSLGQFILAMEKENGLSSKTRKVMKALIGEAADKSHSVRVAFDDEFKKFASPQNYALYKKLKNPITSKKHFLR